MCGVTAHKLSQFGVMHDFYMLFLCILKPKYTFRYFSSHKGVLFLEKFNVSGGSSFHFLKKFPNSIETNQINPFQTLGKIGKTFGPSDHFRFSKNCIFIQKKVYYFKILNQFELLFPLGFFDYMFLVFLSWPQTSHEHFAECRNSVFSVTTRFNFFHRASLGRLSLQEVFSRRKISVSFCVRILIV